MSVAFLEARSAVFAELAALCALATVCVGQERGEIVVTATRTERGIYDLPAGIQILDSDQLRLMNATTLDQALRIALGVDIQGGGFPGESVKLNMRGLSTGYQCDRVLVLLDGRRLNDAFQGNVDLAVYPMSNVERIEILRGPASALYGSNAEGGVINIITRRGGERPGADITAIAGSHGLQKYQAEYGGAEGRADYMAAAGYVRSDGYARNSDGTRRDWSEWNAEANVGSAIGADTTVRVNAGASEGEGTGEIAERTARRDHQAVSFESLWDRDRDARLKVSLYRHGAYDRYDWKYPGQGVYRQDAWVGEAVQSLWIGERHLATVGAETRRESVDIDDVQYALDRSSTTVASFLQDEWNVGEHFVITAGGRYDHNPDISDEFDPRGGILWKLARSSEVFASVNRAHRAPALSDRFVRVEYQGALFEGNPDLKPEILTGYEAGFRKRFSDRAALEISAFWNDMKDTFDFIPVSEGLFRSTNITRLWTAGVEAGGRMRLQDWLTLTAHYVFTDGSYEEFADPAAEGKRPAYLARHQASAGAELEVRDRINCAFTVRYSGDRYGDPQNSEARRMDEYVTADVHARLAVSGNVHVLLGIENIFDERYEEYPGIRQPDRIMTAGLNVSF